ncbi:hypothetical protein HMSSN036_31410 [Paenibacillus macerans]|nr:hypothetical protein HMSSN036_31410 [Paenibacillus macerans]
MITTVTLHAAIDRTYYVDEFSLGQVHRVARQVDEPGGKGNNVAKVIRQLGARSPPPASSPARAARSLNAAWPNGA